MEYIFVSPGESSELRSQKELYLDVGNALCLGVIDHHHLVDEQKSATHLLLENPNFIPQDTEIIVLHKSPDLDCIAASYLANYFVKYHEFPAFALELALFVDKSDFGFKLSSRVNLSSLFSILKSQTDTVKEVVRLGHTLIENLAKYGFNTAEISSLYVQEKETILNDKKIFTEDLRDASVLPCKLQLKSDLSLQRLNALVLKTPKSRLFKEWAREEGFDLLIVQWSTKRVVISLKADSFYTLKDVGKTLNSAEKNKREALDIQVEEANREGYDIPDPWYDGRAHNYTIVDSPKRGTVLSFEEILTTLV